MDTLNENTISCLALAKEKLVHILQRSEKEVNDEENRKQRLSLDAANLKFSKRTLANFIQLIQMLSGLIINLKLYKTS